jgi:hypothetical protein
LDGGHKVKFLIFEGHAGHLTAINQDYIVEIRGDGEETSRVETTGEEGFSEYAVPVEFKKLLRDLEAGKTLNYLPK